MPRGIHSAGDVITQLSDGTNLNDLWNDYQALVTEYNAQRNKLINFLTVPTTSSYENIFVPGAGDAQFEEATDYGEPVGYRPNVAGDVMGYPFKWFDLAARFTWQFLADADSRQVDAVASMAAEADTRLIFQNVMRRLFSNARGLNKEAQTVYPFYSGQVGDKPPSYGSTDFADQHNHFTTTGSATLDQADLEDLIDNVTEHGYTRALGYNVVVLVNKAQGDVIRGFRSTPNGGNGLFDFIPAQGTPAFLLPANMQVSTTGPAAPPATYEGLTVIGQYGDAWIIQEDYIPAGYLVAMATGGADSLTNPIAFREHTQTSLRGLALVKGRTPDYPLIDSFYMRGFGLGIRHRGAGAVLQVTASATYAPPAQYA